MLLWSTLTVGFNLAAYLPGITPYVSGVMSGRASPECLNINFEFSGNESLPNTSSLRRGTVEAVIFGYIKGFIKFIYMLQNPVHAKFSYWMRVDERLLTKLFFAGAATLCKGIGKKELPKLLLGEVFLLFECMECNLGST